MTIARAGPGIILAWLAVVSSAGPAVAGPPPSRIVSLNVCTDQILIDLVPKERIAAVSILAADPSVSAATEAARGLKLIHIAAEEVLAADPDLVLAGEGWTPATVGLLRRLGRRVVVVPLATSLAGVRTAVRMIAEAVGETERGERLLAEFDRRVAAARPGDGPRLTAIAYQINSLSAGPGSLLDAALDAAGFDNLARRLPLGPAGRLPLETLVSDPPDLIVLTVAPDQFRTVAADNLRHPALADVLSRRAHIRLEMPLWLCGTPHVAEAVERLRAAREALLRER